MAICGSGASFVKTKRTKGFTTLLSSAACEWFLIFLLLLDALLSYLLKKFASYCQLQLPCLLCSRLDHILDGENPEFYQNLFCSNHKSEISSLIQCHVHGKLVDGHRMCDDCLLSFTANTKRNTKTSRLLTGKLGVVLGGSGLQSPSLSRDLFTVPKGARPCTCCGKLWKSEQNVPRSIQLKQVGRAVLKPYIPLPHAPRQSRLNHRDNLKKTRDKVSESEGKSSFKPHTHVGYTVLRLTSDSESEFPFSDDDDDVGSVVHENIEAGNDRIAQVTSTTPTKCVNTDLNTAKPNDSSPEPVPLCNVTKHQDVNDNCMVETNFQQTNQESSSSGLPELISLDQVSPSPVVVNVTNREPESEECNISVHSEDSLNAPLSELMTQSHTPVKASPKKSVDVTRARDVGNKSENASTETDLKASDFVSLSPTQENSSNKSKSHVTAIEREVPDVVIEQPTKNEIDKVKEELGLSPSQHSSLHVSDVPSVAPIDHVHSPEIHAEASRLVESVIEYLDGSNITEIEGESIVDRLKRLIAHDKKCMDDLQKELEEERNASAIAANEAMSMITRLQEEKAALQMEALQYLRMMEEQAEYDNEEFEKVNDLLTEKEKEMQDLEDELEYYRSNSNLKNEPMVHNIHQESRDSKGENVMAQSIGLHNITDTVINFPQSKLSETSKVSDEAGDDKTSILEFEEEKQYITQCLSNLEKKLHQVSFNRISPQMHNVISESNQQGDSKEEEPHLDGHEDGDFSMQKNIISNGNLDDKDDSATSYSDDCSLSIENSHSTPVGENTSITRREIDLVALENEISDLNDRLEALEFDHDLIEHIINSFQNGNDGKQFIQDIAHQLHELRKAGITSRCMQHENAESGK